MANQTERGPAKASPLNVALRSDLTRHLGDDAFPADRDGLLDRLRGSGATDRLIDRIGALPGDVRYKNVQEVAAALGL